MLVERASKATRQRGPPPQGSTASHERYVMGGDTPSACRHRHPENPAGHNPTKGCAEGVLYSHRGRLQYAVVAPCPLPGFLGRRRQFGAGREGLALEPAPPGAGRPTLPLVPANCGLRVGWGLRATALRKGRPHTPEPC